MADAVKLDAETFCTRLKKLYTSWQGGGDEWGVDQRATAVAIFVGAAREEIYYSRATALQLWLFAYELTDTILLFTKDALHVLTSAKKAALLQALAEPCRQRCGVELTFHARQKGDDGRAQADALLAAARASGAPPVLGVLPKEKHEGKLGEAWAGALAGAGLATADVTAGLGAPLAAKDAAEVTCVKKAAFLAGSAMQKFFVQELERIIDEEKKVRHAKFAAKLEEVIADPGRLGVKLRPDNVDVAYPPIVQSGGVYSLKPNAQSDERHLQYDVITASIGARYLSYCANVARTYVIDPSKGQEAQYRALLDAQAAAIGALVDGAPLSAAHAAATAALQERGQADLAERLPRAVGWGMGLEFRESQAQLTAENATPARPGMVFNVTLGVGDLEREPSGEGRATTYALLVADTVVVAEGGAPPEVATALANKGWTDAAYYFKEEGEGEEEEPATPAREALKYDANGAVKKAALRSENEAQRAADLDRRKQKENQEDLLRKVNDATLAALTAARGGGADGGRSGRRVSDLAAYAAPADVPPARDLAVQVDQRSEAVLAPIYGVMVPFHVLTVKGAAYSADGDHAVIRLNFNFGPGWEPGQRHPGAIMLKELSYRSSDTRHAQKVVQEIKVLRASVSQREKEKAERATLVQQERLVKAKGRMYTLPDVWIRPPFGGKGRKMTGQLEAHANGFRYTSPKGEQLDIMYRNVKHAFFQPADGEMVTLVHFHLVNPIMVGKKKTNDVQFYTEVMDTVQTVDAGRRSMYDPDELEEEQREREIRNKINKQFNQFVKRVQQDVWERDFGDMELEFEIPFRELGFSGVPHRTASNVMPTVNCLVELLEMPFTVITMAEVNIVNLERVGFNLRNFDMTVVFKDLTRDVVRIDAIPSTSLDTIREWLGSINIKFYESKINLNWKPILKSIIEDPEGFVEDGGWNFLDQEGGSDAEGEEDESEGDGEFKPESGEEEEEEEESSGGGSSEDESLVDSEDAGGEDDEDEEEDLEEAGLSWEELEEEAMQEDRQNANGDDDDDDDRGKRKKGGGGGGGGGGGKRARR